MVQVQKVRSDLRTYWFAGTLVILLLGIYGRDAAAWILMKLYEFFIQRNLVKP